MPSCPLPRVSPPPGKDPESKRESLTHLYNEKALRYGIVFDELIRQVAVHSMALATLVGKAFTGHHALLTRLIKVHDAREGQLQKLQDLNALAKLIDGVHFINFLKGINKEGRKAMRRTKETQTRPTRDKKSDSRPGTGTGGKKRPPKKTKGSKTEILPLDLRNSIGMASAPKKIPTLGYMLRTVLDMMLVWSRSLDTPESLCKKPGGMTEIAIKHFQLLHGMENTTNLMLAQFAAGLVHFADYKRCKVLGDLLGVDDPATGPPFDHRSALFLYRFLAELRTVGVFSEDILRERIIKINLNKTAVSDDPEQR
ncbi:hypothetical protein Esi_0215_0030 [Ectocarpus siliculosus]|uniref:Uncharacterized protein n=1 Tax=Ectocarpus siliculosus TaxID=2880 RepID=D7FRJ6_ECTSI|nr:hypothetical protein Esi_0215_0030 [Ectocarpus siliculosus]|eukprot:CBJ30787.1 hypothetical protein Esi_0215_0030 [Ectocarpus siliculosus]